MDITVIYSIMVAIILHNGFTSQYLKYDFIIQTYFYLLPNTRHLDIKAVQIDSLNMLGYNINISIIAVKFSSATCAVLFGNLASLLFIRIR